MRFPEPKKHRVSLGILDIHFGLRVISHTTPSKSRCFACTGDDLFQNRASRVDGRLCFRCGTARIDPWPVAKPCHRANTRPTQRQHRPTQSQHKAHTEPTQSQHRANTEPTQGQTTGKHKANTETTQSQHRANTEPTQANTEPTQSQDRPTQSQHRDNTGQHRANTRPTQSQHRLITGLESTPPHDFTQSRKSDK